MSRSPLAYPLNRAADADAGGAADLQTDIMRFMAILSMCLLAIFALVQSIPLAPVEKTTESVEAKPEPVVAKPEPVVTKPEPVAAKPEPVAAAPEPVGASLLAKKPEETIVLTRPKWESTYKPTEPKPVASKLVPTSPTPVASKLAPTSPAPVASELPPTDPPAVEPAPEPTEDKGFTLRFASDAALMRAVAAQHVGLYAIEPGRARRMTVSDSRISFWDASTPNTFHEMETGTVPLSVVEALGRSGAASGSVSWGVTLPGRMKAQLDELLHAHRGGSLIITADGDIHWEAS